MQPLSEEILHLEYNRVVLILKALNREPTYEMAAKALGICLTTLQFYRDAYKVTYDKPTKRFIAGLWPQVGRVSDEQPVKEYSKKPEEVDAALLVASLPSVAFL